MSHDVDDNQNDAVERAADSVRTGVDAVSPDILLRIHSTKSVATIHESVVDAAIMKVMII